MNDYRYRRGRAYLHETGRTASIYGAHPGGSGWSIVDDGWHIIHPDNIVTRKFATETEAISYCRQQNQDVQRRRAEHAMAWEPINRPVDWTVQIGNDGRRRYHSGENATIVRYGAACFAVETPDDWNKDAIAFRSLKEARAWANDYIRNARRDVAFGA